MKKIAIIGLGNMGKAIFEILSSKKLFSVSGVDKEEDVNVYLSDCEAFVIAVKPQDFGVLAGQINVDLADKLAISIMAGVSIENIRGKTGCGKIVRVMPNLALKYQMSLNGWFGTGLNDGDRDFVKEILDCFGESVEVDTEQMIDSITALSGSGPAYFYYLTQLIKMKALEFGFSGEDAKIIAKTTFLGAAELLKNSDECACDLIDRIKSKGGTTEAALDKLEDGGFDKLFFAALDEAKKRAGELRE